MLKQILTMIARIRLLSKSYVVCSDINERYDIRQASKPRSSRFFALQVIWGSLVSAMAYFLSLKARNSVNCNPICKILISKIFS